MLRLLRANRCRSVLAAVPPPRSCLPPPPQLGFANKSSAGAVESTIGSADVIKTFTEGAPGSLEFKMYFKNFRVGQPARVISPWHDLPCMLGPSHFSVTAYVNEIPKGTRRKMECVLKEPHNPLMQDTKKGKLREFTYGDIPFNYGFIPRTWECPTKVSQFTNLPGDNDPLDVVELSEQPMAMGEVSEIKILGCFALIDEGETDWKILALNRNHPLAEVVHDVEHIEKYFPGVLQVVHDWFKMYKTTDGKPENSFAFDGKPQSAAFACDVVQENHLHYLQDMSAEDRVAFHVPAATAAGSHQ